MIPMPKALGTPVDVPHRSRRWLWGIVFLGFVLRIAALALIHSSAPVGEEAIYCSRAFAWNNAPVSPADDERAPAVLYLYRGVVVLFGENLSILRFANVLLGTIFLPLFYAWSRRVAGENIALAGTLLAAVHPELIFYSASLWNEPLYLVVIYSLFLFFLHVDRPPTPVQAIFLGFLLGLTSLTREIGVFLAPLVVAAILLSIRSAPKRSFLAASLCLTAFFLTMLPWSIHISQRAGHPVFITDMNTRRLFVGITDVPEQAPHAMTVRHTSGYKAYRELSSDPRERQAMARGMILEEIRRELPWWPIEKTKQELPNFFSPNSLPAARLMANPEETGWAERWAFRFSIPKINRRQAGLALGALTIAFHVAITLAGSAGLVLLPLRRAALPILVFGFMHLAPTLVTTACSRYRIPLTPIFILGAAALLVQGPRLWMDAGRTRRLAGCAVFLLAAIILALRIQSILTPQYG